MKFNKITWVLLIIAALGVSYFIYNITLATPTPIVDVIIKNNDVALKESQDKVKKIKEELLLSQKREIKLLVDLQNLLTKNEKDNNKFDSTRFSNTQLSILFSEWRPSD
jgi:hypothetical protein|tara:strand:- start:91 stop:417 length:327 start_codon:yes stop_codon:yes gene_type:complete